MARHILGENWMLTTSKRANDGGIERVLVLMAAVLPYECICAPKTVVRWSGASARLQPGTRELPAFYRVIWNAHVAEFRPLGRGTCLCMDAVAVVEALRQHLAPAKINLQPSAT